MINDIINKQVEEFRKKHTYNELEAHLVRSMKKVSEEIVAEIQEWVSKNERGYVNGAVRVEGIIDMHEIQEYLSSLTNPMKKQTPFLAVGNDELEDNADVSETAICPHCKKMRKVEYGEEILKDGTRKPSKKLAFINCGKKSYLVGIGGKLLSIK